MKKNLYISLGACALVASSLLASGCGKQGAKNVTSSSSGIGIGAIGCATLNGPIAFRGTNIPFDGRTLNSSAIQGASSFVIGGPAVGSQYHAESNSGSVVLDIRPRAATNNGYYYAYQTQLADVDGTLTLSAQAQLDAVNRISGMYNQGYNGGYNNGYNSGYPYGGGYNNGYTNGYNPSAAVPVSSMCVSNVSLQMSVSNGRLYGTLRAYLGNTQFSTDLYFY